MGVFFMVMKTNFAYLLITCDIGKLDDVITQIKNLGSIKEFQGTYGAYDIIAKVETLSKQHLQRFIVQKISTLVGVRSALKLECKQIPK